MRIVAVKTVEQEAVLTMHRARQGYVEEDSVDQSDSRLDG